jgi:hypothetical protein
VTDRLRLLVGHQPAGDVGVCEARNDRRDRRTLVLAPDTDYVERGAAAEALDEAIVRLADHLGQTKLGGIGRVVQRRSGRQSPLGVRRDAHVVVEARHEHRTGGAA